MKLWSKEQGGAALRIGALTALALSAALVTGCSLQPAAADDTNGAQEAPQTKIVRIEKVGKTKIGEPLEQVADVLASVQIDVFAKTSAEVEAVLKKRGDWVEAGETIVQLKQDDALLALESAELGLRSAQRTFATGDQEIANQKLQMKNQIARMEQQAKDLEENYNLMLNEFELGNVTQRELDQTKTNLTLLQSDLDLLKKQEAAMDAKLTMEQYEIQLKQAQLQYEQAERQMENYNIKAPISGLLTELPLEVAMTTQPGTKALQVVKTDPLKVKAELTQSAADAVRGKTELTFYVPGVTEAASGTVAFLSPVMNAATKSYTLELEVPNKDNKLMPGMKAQVLLSEEEDQVVVAVPTSSIVREGSENYVFVLKGDTVERRQVKLGRINETMQEVLSGVSEGEDLVISGQHQLNDQEKVQLAQ
ncbi:efflux RND transporter periplasmic adaptor subunit [Paenibacillus antri]|uniref:Efflux RND transporter periplasmic adaptor subunit n=1 Tax=Paenibacillus antri TaxID=2582848 RepID=A0A5R9G857_9BACL|nr:efflux RND transporter periplasmic adaptor subunit [Paenibacillus antri]TLS50556.1 efflux RND transporter periplasmic adaptor subunit [Paenibacillus antri]